jgi:hypothetical protein
MQSVATVSCDGSPISHKSFAQTSMMFDDDYSPRSRNGVGATVKVFKDAHEVIMGNDEGYTGGVRQLPEGRYRLTSLDSVVQLYPARSSSLPGTPDAVEGAAIKHAGPSVGMFYSPMLKNSKFATYFKTISLLLLQLIAFLVPPSQA